MNLQPTLENETLRIRPLEAEDFEALFALASDPEVWAQHPNPNRYQKPVFETFFQGAMESKGAFLVFEKAGGLPVGTSRYYDFDPIEKKVVIGYTFFGKAFWGGKFNPALKKLMLDYAFRFVDRVQFHVGAVNRRSQIAMERLGAEKISEKKLAYYGEASQPNFLYEIRKADWI
jgi:RimJ/RimL family protein N-acetyltransferase